MKPIFYMLLFFISIASIAQSTVSIKGIDIHNYQKVSLYSFDYTSLKYVKMRSKPINTKGEFYFEIPYTNANAYKLRFDDEKSIYLSIENANPIILKSEKNNIQIIGSSSSSKMNLFRQENEALQAKHFGQLKIEMDKAAKENDKKKLHELQQKVPVAIQAYLKEFRQQILNLGTTPAGYYALQFSDFIKELDFIEQRLAVYQKELPNSPVTLALKKQVYQAKITAIGKTPPMFEVIDSKGTKLSLSSYRGKVTLIDFWAAWCRACRIEHPKLVNLYQKYAKKNFAIIGVSQDKTETRWLKAIEKDGVGLWRQIWDKDLRISTLYSVSSLPQNILLDKNGKIIAKNITTEELEVQLNNLIQ